MKYLTKRKKFKRVSVAFLASFMSIGVSTSNVWAMPFFEIEASSETSNDEATFTLEEARIMAFNELTRSSRMAGQGNFRGRVNTPGTTLVVRDSSLNDTGVRLAHGTEITSNVAGVGIGTHMFIPIVTPVSGWVSPDFLISLPGPTSAEIID